MTVIKQIRENELVLNCNGEEFVLRKNDGRDRFEVLKQGADGKMHKCVYSYGDGIFPFAEIDASLSLSKIDLELVYFFNNCIQISMVD